MAAAAATTGSSANQGTLAPPGFPFDWHVRINQCQLATAHCTGSRGEAPTKLCRRTIQLVGAQLNSLTSVHPRFQSPKQSWSRDR